MACVLGGLGRFFAVLGRSRGLGANLPNLMAAFVAICCAIAMRIFLITPPMTQINTPYPATAYLTGCLHRHAPSVEVVQSDFSQELFCGCFAARLVAGVRRAIHAGSPSAWAKQSDRHAGSRSRIF